MERIYHCGINPQVICQAATLGCMENVCNDCKNNKKKKKERKANESNNLQGRKRT